MTRNRTAFVCTVCWLAVTAGLAHSQGPATDKYGDPLPAGALARLGTTRFRHDASIVFAAFLPGGKSVLSVSYDGVLCVWEFPSGKETARVEAVAGPGGRVTSATLSPNGKHLTAFCDDGYLRIWDWAAGKELGKVVNVRANVGSGIDGLAPTHSPDGKTLMLGTRVLQFVDLAAGKGIGPDLGHTESVSSVLFTANGTQLITQDGRTVCTWDAATGKAMGSFAMSMKLMSGSGTSSPFASTTTISPDGAVGITVGRISSLAQLQGAKELKAQLFDTATGKVFAEIAIESEGVAYYRKPLLFSPDNKMLAVVLGDAQQKVVLYEIPSGKQLRTLDAGPAAPPPKLGGVKGFPGFLRSTNQRLVFSPDSKLLAFQAGPGAGILILDTATSRQVGSLPADKDLPLLQGVFTSDGRCLALERKDGTVTMYEIATGLPRATYGIKAPVSKADDDVLDSFFGPARVKKINVTVAVSPDSNLLAIAGPGGAIHLWDILTGKQVAALKGHRGAVNGLAFAPKGKVLASAGFDTTALLWDMSKVARPAFEAKQLLPEDAQAWWQALGENDAEKAFAAQCGLAATGNDAVGWIKKHVPPATPVDPKQASKLIQQLDAEKFNVRQKAHADLLKLGEPVLPFLEKALKAAPSGEVRERLEGLRNKLMATALQGDRLRIARAIEVLERIDNSGSRQYLKLLAAGAPGALTTVEAQAALRR